MHRCGSLHSPSNSSTCFSKHVVSHISTDNSQTNKLNHRYFKPLFEIDGLGVPHTFLLPAPFSLPWVSGSLVLTAIPANPLPTSPSTPHPPYRIPPYASRHLPNLKPLVPKSPIPKSSSQKPHPKIQAFQKLGGATCTHSEVQTNMDV